MEINKLIKEIHENAIAHGWWKKEPSFGEIIALCHSELSEALEEYRKNGEANNSMVYFSNCNNCGKKENKPEGIAVELADCIIRILDYCGKQNIDIEKVIELKHEYNKTRPYLHGGKKL